MSLLLLFVTCCILPLKSQTDVSSFGIVTASDSDSSTIATVVLTLSWNLATWECIIQPTQPDTYYGCTTYVNPFATLITNSLTNNTYLMKIEILNDTNDLLRIETIKVTDEDSNYYHIESFCLPKEFSNTDAMGTTLELIECCYWLSRYRYNNFAMGNNLRITYAQFIENILNFPKTAREGAIHPPKINSLGIQTLNSVDAGTSNTFNMMLHWDSDEYQWIDFRPKSPNKVYTKTFGSSNTSCSHSSGFSLTITSLSVIDLNDVFGIDFIFVIDETNHTYNLYYFCNAPSIQNSAQSDNLGTYCDYQWAAYQTQMYDGFIYNGSDPIYFIWSDTLFFNIDNPQQGFVTDNTALCDYSCNSNIDHLGVVFKDDMDNPTGTGWIFTGSYTESINAINCPGGPLDNCMRIAGNVDTSTAIIQVDISEYTNIVIKYDLTLTNMPSGKHCKLQYAFDGSSSFTTAITTTSTGTSPQYYHNISWTSGVDHIEKGYSILSLRFKNDAENIAEYCWIDHLYVLGDYLIDYDSCSTFDSSWESNGAYAYSSGSSYCSAFNSYCIHLPASAYPIKMYNNINQYNNIGLSFDLSSHKYISVYYAYDDQAYILADIFGSTTYDSYIQSYPDQKFSIPDADICGATTLYVKFVALSGSLYTSNIDNVKLYGYVLNTANPTESPTLIPTSEPTSITDNPTNQPSKSPINIPTLSPNLDPTKTPTNIPSGSPTNPPTTNPSSLPSSIPTHRPTFPSETSTISQTTERMTTTVSSNIINVSTSMSISLISSIINETSINQEYDSSINSQAIHDIFEAILIGTVSFFVLIILVSYVDSKFFRINDFYKIFCLIRAAVHVLDMISDIFFTVHISVHPDFEGSTLLFIIFISSIIFIAVPVLISLGQLYNEINKEWEKVDELRAWAVDYANILYLLSIACGSSFAAVSLVSTNLFGLASFSLPISKVRLVAFENKRVYSVVLLENIPQLILQIVYLFTSAQQSEFNQIVYVSMVFSLVSIIAAIISMLTRRNLLYSQNYVNIQFDVLFQGEMVTSAISACTNRINNIRNHFATMFGIEKSLIEITQATRIPDGLKININLFINHTKEIDMNCKKVIENAQNNGRIAEIIKISWNLEDLPKIINIKYKQIKSQFRTKNTVAIAMDPNIQMQSMNLPQIPKIKIDKHKTNNDDGEIESSASSDDDLNSNITEGTSINDNVPAAYVLNEQLSYASKTNNKSVPLLADKD